MLKKFFLPFCFSISLALSAQPNEEIELMANWFVGTYTNSGEAYGTDNNELAGLESMRIVRIWDDKEDVWLYLEQSAAATPEKPFRQWILRIEESQENLYMLEPHIIESEKTLDGNHEAIFIGNHVKIDELDVVNGCEFFVDYDGFVAFSGSTVENFCDTDIAGASILKIKFNLLENKIDWWEQGFDEEGKQLWGTTTKPVIFTKN
jgi:hypothetical protein